MMLTKSATEPAAPEHDHLGIACALALEQDAGGWVPPWTAAR